MLPRLSETLRRQLPCRMRWFVLVAVLHAGFLPTTTSGQSTPHDGQGLKPILEYISTAWDTLTRSMTDCQSLVDPKIKVPPVLYLPADVAEPAPVHKRSSDW